MNNDYTLSLSLSYRDLTSVVTASQVILVKVAITVYWRTHAKLKYTTA